MADNADKLMWRAQVIAHQCREFDTNDELHGYWNSYTQRKGLHVRDYLDGGATIRYNRPWFGDSVIEVRNIRLTGITGEQSSKLSRLVNANIIDGVRMSLGRVQRCRLGYADIPSQLRALTYTEEEALTHRFRSKL